MPNLTLGAMARKDIQSAHDAMEFKSDEPAEDLAARMFAIHIEIYSSYCGHDLEDNFDTLPSDIKQSWIKVAEDKLRAARVKEATDG